MRGALALAAVFGIVILSARAVVAQQPASAAATRRWGPDYFPNVPLTTQDGRVVHLYDDLLKDRIVAIDLIYTTCKYQCPLETARLAQVQQMLGDRVGKDIFFYSITIDPEHDTPAVLKAYGEKFHAGPGWLFLTGKASDIELVSKKLGLYSDPSESRDGHTTALMIGNVATGQWMKNGATDNPRFLALMIGEMLTGWRNRAAPVRSYAEAPRLQVGQGQYLFATRCAACHTIGHGALVGPDLAGVTVRRDRAWLTRFIAKPEELFEENDRVALELAERYKQVRMPDLRLGDGDVALLIDYLEAQDSGGR